MSRREAGLFTSLSYPGQLVSTALLFAAVCWLFVALLEAHLAIGPLFYIYSKVEYSTRRVKELTQCDDEARYGGGATRQVYGVWFGFFHPLYRSVITDSYYMGYKRNLLIPLKPWMQGQILPEVCPVPPR